MGFNGLNANAQLRRDCATGFPLANTLKEAHLARTQPPYGVLGLRVIRISRLIAKHFANVTTDIPLARQDGANRIQHRP